MQEITNWLMEGDPSIKWQVMQDLLNEDFGKVFTIRRSMSKIGWASELLSYQADDGKWGGGLYSPKWTSTTYTMLFLKRLGLLPNKKTVLSSKILVNGGIQRNGGISYSKSKKSETCITGMILGIASYNVLQDNRLDDMINYIENQQMDDGGWNCRDNSKHSSFNTTLLVLEGLLSFRETFSDNNKLKVIRSMQKEAHEFLLTHRLYQSHKTGEIAHKEFIKLSFPSRWRYNILSSLNYFQNIGFRYDDRFIDAINILRNKENKGKWRSQKTFYSGKVFHDLEPSRIPSRWVTFHAMRINKWWDRVSRGKI